MRRKRYGRRPRAADVLVSLACVLFVPVLAVAGVGAGAELVGYRVAPPAWFGPVGLAAVASYVAGVVAFGLDP